MAEIQSAVIAADINDDGKIELVTTDTHGNVAAWTAQGEEIWEAHVKSLVPQVSCGLLSVVLPIHGLYDPLLGSQFLNTHL